MYATDPQYATGSERAGLALRGYKATGEQNTFGKVMSWMPALGLAQNAMARNYAERIGATDTWENIKEDTDNRLMKQGVISWWWANGSRRHISRPCIRWHLRWWWCGSGRSGYSGIEYSGIGRLLRQVRVQRLRQQVQQLQQEEQ
jgi:hypothetical protein